MMSYASDFVLAIINQGSPVREINNQVHLRFGSEYKIRLKNKTQGLRCKAKVWVDGRLASGMGDIVLNAGQTLDLERFLDHDLNSGNKFKFVSLDDNRVNDPTDSSNGIIKVEFYREVPLFNFNFTPWPPYPTYPRKGNSGGRRYGSSGGTGAPDFEITWTDSTASQNFPAFNNLLIGSATLCSNSVSPGASPSSLPGATVEGGTSNQKFVQVSDFQTESFPTTLSLTIRGIKEEPKTQPVKQQSEFQNVVRFCSYCGKRKQKRADKFCTRCGMKFN